MLWSITIWSHRSAWDLLTKNEDGYLTANTVDDLCRQLQEVALRIETRTAGGATMLHGPSRYDFGLGRLEVEDYTDQVDTFYRDRRGKRRRFMTCMCEGG